MFYLIFSLLYLRPITAVQEERQRKDKAMGDSEVESTSSANNDMPVEKILEAELAVEPNTETYVDTPVSLTDTLACILKSGLTLVLN